MYDVQGSINRTMQVTPSPTSKATKSHCGTTTYLSKLDVSTLTTKFDNDELSFALRKGKCSCLKFLIS